MTQAPDYQGLTMTTSIMHIAKALVLTVYDILYAYPRAICDAIVGDSPSWWYDDNIFVYSTEAATDRHHFDHTRHKWRRTAHILFNGSVVWAAIAVAWAMSLPWPFLLMIALVGPLVVFAMSAVIYAAFILIAIVARETWWSIKGRWKQARLSN